MGDLRHVITTRGDRLPPPAGATARAAVAGDPFPELGDDDFDPARWGRGGAEE